MSILTCYYCGSENPDTVFHCTQCGAPLKHGHGDLGLSHSTVIPTRGLLGLALTTRTFGIDVSHWDGVIDWLAIRQAGIVKFCILKATEGKSFIDDKFAANKAGCQLIGMPWAAYHFFRPAEDPIDQAWHFYQQVGSGCNVYVADVEIAGADLANRLKIFIEELKHLGARKIVIYTGPYFWRENIGNVSWAGTYDLWIANYGVNEPMIPLPWTNYIIWQYSDKGQVAGINAAVDDNWFKGDTISMYDYFKNGNEVLEPPATPEIVQVTTTSLNIRRTPMGTVVGNVPLGTLLGVNGESIYNKVKWYKIGTAYVSSQYCKEV